MAGAEVQLADGHVVSCVHGGGTGGRSCRRGGWASKPEGWALSFLSSKCPPPQAR